MKMYKNKVKIGEKLLNVVTINQEDQEDTTVVEGLVAQSVHHIHVIDRSGSMYREITGLVEQVKDTLKLMSVNDLISVIWFSSEGQYRTLVKGAKNSPQLLSLLDTLKSTLGCTCFSDPIQEVKTIVNELHALNPNISVTLFTDGEAVCSRGKDAEEQRTLKIVSEFADKIIAFNTVGYSCYYNQKFLKDLAALSQFGVFTHSSQIGEYSSIFQNNFERISGGKVEKVDLLYADDIIGVYLTRKFVKMETGAFHLSRLDKNKNQFFLVSTGEFEFEYNGEHFNSKQIKEEAALPTITNFMYAYAQGLYYNNFRKNSLEVLASIGDKALIDSHMSAFTFDEAGEHQKKLEAAALNTSARLLDGKAKANYLPAKDAFCVMDLIGLLANNNAYYMPFHKEAEDYERIGKKTEESFNVFTYSDEPVYTPFSDLVYNKDKANLSIRNKIAGIVTINPTEAKENGLPQTVDSYIYRNHALIKDGRMNIKKAVVLMPKSLYETIQAKRKVCELLKTDTKFVKEISKEHGEDYVLTKLTFTKLPVINSLYNDMVTAENVFGLAAELLDWECVQKVLNYYWKKFDETATAAQKKVGIFEGKTAKQMEILAKHGLEKSGSYKGIGKSQAKAADCDFYEARSFEFQFKGLTTMPKVEDVIGLKADGTAKLTPPKQKMMTAVAVVGSRASADKIDLSKASVATRNWLTQQIKEVKYRLFKLRGSLCAAKMAKIITGDSFEGFTVSGDQFTYEKNGNTLIMKMDKEKVYFG